MAVKDYIREKFFPHIWCPGCGHGIALNGLLHAIESIGLEEERHRDGVGDRLFVADRGVPRFSYAAHDPRAGAGVRHRGEDEPSGSHAPGADGRRRCPVDRGKPLHPCLPAEHRHDGDRDEQQGVRNDGRAVSRRCRATARWRRRRRIRISTRSSMWSTWRRRRGPRSWRAPRHTTSSSCPMSWRRRSGTRDFRSWR